MSDTTCDSCARWTRSKDFPTTGVCPLRGDTAAGYTCGSWIPSGEPQAAPLPPPEKKPFDYRGSAAKVLAAGGVISPVSVQRLLRCTYGQAAIIIDDLRQQGKIG